MSVTFRIKASEAQGRRLDPEYHHALRRTRVRSTYPSAKLLSLAYFRTGGTPSTAHPEYWNGSIPWVSANHIEEKFYKIAISPLSLPPYLAIINARPLNRVDRDTVLKADVPQDASGRSSTLGVPERRVKRFLYRDWLDGRVELRSDKPALAGATQGLGRQLVSPVRL